MIRVDVPGKALIAGEYAVLLPGEPCLVAAVERRLTAVSQRSDVWNARSGSATWREGNVPPEQLRFVVGAIEAVGSRWFPPPCRVETSDDLSDGENKLGLGGSAAATVAAAFAAAEGTDATRDELWALCDEVHRRVQGGKGSGADVAASVHGGVVRYVREPRSVTPVVVHPDVRIVLAWTGRSVKTAPRLERWNRFVQEKKSEAERFARLSREAVAITERGLAAGDETLLRDGIGQSRAALHELEAELGVELETPALAAAADAAFRVGACGKLSGAGGGDCAVVLTLGDEGVERVVRALEEAGVMPIPVGLAREGVRVERR